MLWVVILVTILTSGYLIAVITKNSIIIPIKNKSTCSKCGHKLEWYDTIPIISYLSLSGRCRYCGAPIPRLYPIGETTLLGLWIISLFMYNSFYEAIYLLFWVTLLWFYAFYDIVYLAIPEKPTNCLTAIGLGKLVIEIIKYNNTFYIWNLALITMFLLIGYLLIEIKKKEWFGWGDIRFIVMLLTLMSWGKFIVGFWLASIIGGIVAIVYLIIKGSKAKKEIIPYLPIIGSGMAISIFTNYSIYFEKWIKEFVLVLPIVLK